MLAQQDYNFRSYARNLNRVQLAEFLDNHRHDLRWAALRPSLILNPVTNLPYGEPATGQTVRSKANDN